MILQVSDAGFSYDGRRSIFEGISFSLDTGECLCILGPNGTGKSTLIKCLLNLLPLGQGCIQLAGEEIADLSRTEIAKKIAYVPQSHQIVFPFTVGELVLMGRTPHLPAFAGPGKSDSTTVQAALETVGIAHLAERPVSDISGGELQLALIARAVAQQPEILILDEPTSHLDFGNQIRVLQLIDRLARNGIGVIMTSHFPDHSFVVRQTVAIMKGGNFIAVGPPEEVLTPQNLGEAYGIDVAVPYVTEAGRQACVPKIILKEKGPGFIP
ncbi:ABC transporter ATP-binding protein [Methanofollis aquaemaris]|uniref:Cobalamin import ATP-binding protein BtuD n=1 Tax=Methanofollis aquaemaris TaxID=126734 RepID=A0A8A3S5Z8_9EURY|nr:ABC transporter ATP-binding protein [Methanofollis aquaemaris]QSZ67687.1 ABC transporter ATP-binding protein [Methanofollis aquaemaris]